MFECKRLIRTSFQVSSTHTIHTTRTTHAPRGRTLAIQGRLHVLLALLESSAKLGAQHAATALGPCFQEGPLAQQVSRGPILATNKYCNINKSQ